MDGYGGQAIRSFGMPGAVGRYDSGLALLRFGEAHPGRLRVAERIGAVVDPRPVYGCEPFVAAGVTVWPEAVRRSATAQPPTGPDRLSHPCAASGYRSGSKPVALARLVGCAASR